MGEEDEDKKAIDEVEKEEREMKRREEKERSGEKRRKDDKDDKDGKDAQNKGSGMTQQQMIMIGAAVLLVCGVGYWYYTKDDAGGSGNSGNIVAADCSAQEAKITALTGRIKILETTNSELADDLKDSEKLNQKRLGDTIGVSLGLAAFVALVGGYYLKTQVWNKKKKNATPTS